MDKSFADMAYKIEELAKVSVPDFGMSELTLKQIASRYQAMGVAMGFTQGRMSDMSIELTKLAADMASFYNVGQKAVAESLESVFTGTTRPLRTYGLDFTQATYYDNFYSNYSNNKNSSYAGIFSSNYTEEEKKIFKEFYRTLSKKFHPDANPDMDTSRQMKLLNRLKSDWGV